MPTASFDVFDTLLTRIWAEPRDLFVALGQELNQQGLIVRSPVAFARLREQGERIARTDQPAKEVRLEQIYDKLSGFIGWDATQQQQAMAAEIAWEIAGIRPVPGRDAAVQAARHRCGRILFLTDMYLPAETIRQCLITAGHYQAGDLVLVSGEAGQGKGRGGLFQLARAQWQADYADWTHCGDHPSSDVAAPQALGITARLDQTAQLSRHERHLRGPAHFATPARSQVAAAARLARLEADPTLSERQRTLWEIGATVAGPLFWGFTKWCLAEARQEKLSKLYFLARGGQIFWRIAQLLPEDKQAPIPCHYLYASRLAFAGTIATGDLARLRQLAAPSLTQHSVRQTLANLGLDQKTVELPARWPQSQWDKNLEITERNALADWLLAPERLALVRQALSERTALTREYLARAGLTKGARAGLVDTGWMGTIQKSMEQMLGDELNPAALPSFYLGLSPVREFTCQGACRAYTNTFRRLSLRRETTHLILLEIMASGTHGPLLGFNRVHGQLEPHFGPLPEAQRADAELFQSAVLAFVRRVEETATAQVAAECLAPVLIDNYLDFFHNPSAQEARTIGHMPHADQMLEQQYSTLCQEMSLPEVLKAIACFQSRPPGWWLAGQATLAHAPLLRAYALVKKIKWAGQTLLTGLSD